MTWNGSAGVAFTAASTGLASDLVDYLRGDPANELRKGVGSYRNREAKLGDIVNSSPAYILDNLDMKYQLLVPPLGDYAAFVASKAARPEGVLFVGANDGMLHGFRNSNGVETFAYVPKAVVPNLHKLSQSPYTHQYYVDGPNVETDAFIGGSWKNLLLGTTGAGAKAVFALDVTNPLSLGASNVLWEVSNSTAGFSELGYVFADVQAGVLESGDWVAIFGNGIGSSAGVARLFVVNLQTGALLKNISTGVGGGNGLSGVRVVRDATKRIVGAYAGDLKGNMWKFDLTGASSASWKVGLSGSALYAGGSSQPITAAPAVLPHPNGGYVVTFGTGKFVETVDTTDLSAQTLYGVWDSRPFGEVVAPLGAAPVSGLLQLQPQTITTVTLPGPPPVDYYKVSTNAVVWGDGLLTGKRGWYINLPNSGQRVVYPVERLAGTVVMATTLSPVSSVVADACVQTGSGSGWVYLIDGLTGSGPTKPTLDTNGDGVVDSSDTVVSGYQDPVDGRPTSIKKGSCEADLDNPPPCFKLECQYDIETAQSKAVPVKLLCGQPGMPPCCSTSVPGIKSREWRQLFMR
jgi:type IV pilus assembly protein PilY1